MDKILYKIKSLDKLILRYVINDKEGNFVGDLSLVPTPTQMQIMEYILSHDNTFQKDLEDVLNLRRATVSGVLQTMEKNGLLERKITTEDARTKEITLTEYSKNIFNQNKKRFEKLEEVIIKNISDKDLEIFSSVIDKMKNNLNEMMKDVKK